MKPTQSAAGRQSSPAQPEPGARPARATAIRIALFVLAVAGPQLVNPASGFAGLIVSVSDLTLPAGGTGFVDVHIRSDGSDLLGMYTFEFRIEPLGLPGSRLEFSTSQSDSQLADPDYIFAGNSLKQMSGLRVGDVSEISAPGDTFEGFDFTATLSDIVVDGTDRLLARLELTAATALPPVPGDQFTITLVDSLFWNTQGRVDINADASQLTGTVTISEASAVPEPASLTLFCLGGVGLAAAGRRPRRDATRRRVADRT